MLFEERRLIKSLRTSSNPFSSRYLRTRSSDNFFTELSVDDELSFGELFFEEPSFDDLYFDELFFDDFSFDDFFFTDLSVDELSVNNLYFEESSLGDLSVEDFCFTEMSDWEAKSSSVEKLQLLRFLKNNFHFKLLTSESIQNSFS